MDHEEDVSSESPNVPKNGKKGDNPDVPAGNLGRYFMLVNCEACKIGSALVIKGSEKNKSDQEGTDEPDQEWTDKPDQEGTDESDQEGTDKSDQEETDEDYEDNFSDEYYDENENRQNGYDDYSDDDDVLDYDSNSQDNSNENDYPVKKNNRFYRVVGEDFPLTPDYHPGHRKGGYKYKATTATPYNYPSWVESKAPCPYQSPKDTGAPFQEYINPYVPDPGHRKGSYKYKPTTAISYQYPPATVSKAPCPYQ